MSVEARKWAWALRGLGFEARWVATGYGDVSTRDVQRDIDGCDLVVVENVLSLPLSRSAWRSVAEACRGRATIVHHHDLGWQRPEYRDTPTPPDDATWAHVTINELSRRELAARGIAATTMYNRFAPSPSPSPSPRSTEVDVVRPLVLHPTRAIPRKNVPAAVALAEKLSGTYWLLGPAEDGYGEELIRVLSAATCPVMRGFPDGITIDDAYAMCDVVTLPSTWEGFGNATIESALACKPLAIGNYPVAEELRGFGFDWFAAADAAAVRRFVDEPDEALLARNEQIARDHFSLDALPKELASVLERVL